MKLPPLALGAGTGLLLLLLLWPQTGKALGELAAARGARADLVRAAAMPAKPTPIVRDGLRLAAGDAAAGRAAMMARVQRLAKAGGVLVEETSGLEAPDGLVALRIRLSGAEKAIVALADAFERERPLMRFRSWKLEPVNGGVRLTGEAVAPQ
jgi:hypothetical protein